MGNTRSTDFDSEGTHLTSEERVVNLERALDKIKRLAYFGELDEAQTMEVWETANEALHDATIYKGN